MQLFIATNFRQLLRISFVFQTIWFIQALRIGSVNVKEVLIWSQSAPFSSFGDNIRKLCSDSELVGSILLQLISLAVRIRQLITSSRSVMFENFWWHASRWCSIFQYCHSGFVWRQWVSLWSHSLAQEEEMSQRPFPNACLSLIWFHRRQTHGLPLWLIQLLQTIASSLWSASLLSSLEFVSLMQ